MRYPEDHKERVRARIIAAASRALRRDGIDAVAIPKLMTSVGLTHGGFYVHFRDRDDLVAQAIAHAAGESPLVGDGPAAETFDAYLSEHHLRHPEEGCVIAALGADGPRQAQPVRRVFGEVARGFLRYVDKKLHPRGTKGTISDAALEAGARLVGAIVLARLVRDEALAARILAVAKRQQPR
jgi:TetR/AcrR family transcriptional repressor of nem operon